LGEEWTALSGGTILAMNDQHSYLELTTRHASERIAMLRHGLPDLRAFWENDLRVLGQF